MPQSRPRHCVPSASHVMIWTGALLVLFVCPRARVCIRHVQGGQAHCLVSEFRGPINIVDDGVSDPTTREFIIIIIIRPHRSTTYVIAAYTVVTDWLAWSGLSVCLSVSRYVTLVSPAKTAEPIEMLFGLWDGMGPRNRVRWGSTCAKGRCHGDQFLAFDHRWAIILVVW